MESMVPRVFSILMWCVAVAFSLVAMFFLSLSCIVSEFDDILVVYVFGLPCFLCSAAISTFLILVRRRRLFKIVGILNTISALVTLLCTSHAIHDVLSLNNRVYFGHQGNNYTSLDLFWIGVVPAMVTVATWIIFWISRGGKERTKAAETAT